MGLDTPSTGLGVPLDSFRLSETLEVGTQVTVHVGPAVRRTPVGPDIGRRHTPHPEEVDPGPLLGLSNNKLSI